MSLPLYSSNPESLHHAVSHLMVLSDTMLEAATETQGLPEAQDRLRSHHVFVNEDLPDSVLAAIELAEVDSTMKAIELDDAFTAGKTMLEKGLVEQFKVDFDETDLFLVGVEGIKKLSIARRDSTVDILAEIPATATLDNQELAFLEIGNCSLKVDACVCLGAYIQRCDEEQGAVRLFAVREYAMYLPSMDNQETARGLEEIVGSTYKFYDQINEAKEKIMQTNPVIEEPEANQLAIAEQKQRILSAIVLGQAMSAGTQVLGQAEAQTLFIEVPYALEVIAMFVEILEKLRT